MKIHNPARLMLRTFVLLFIPLAGWLISSCASGEVNLPLLTDIFTRSCDKNTVLLSGFWWLAVTNTSTPPVPTQQTPSIDPLGGSLLLYWIDDQGNVCHGEPGVSGQPGPYEIPAYNPDALSASRQTAVISDEQLRTYQEIDFDTSPYLKDFKPRGLHFVQFAAWLWQDRQTGRAFIDNSTLFFSVPQIGEVNKSFCYLPAYPVKRGECDTPTPLKPSAAYLTAQHPSLCQKRAFPTTDASLAPERVKYCLSTLPHGLETTSRQP